MKKNVLNAFAMCLLAVFSCQKEKMQPAPDVTSGPTSFIVSLPETRTELDGHSVLWVDNDEIRVFGYTEGETVSSAVFQFSGLNDAGLAVFSIKEGETLGEYVNYYAAYPAMAEGITVSVDSKGNATMAFPRLNAFPYNVRNQRPADGGFDPNLTIMTAKYDGERLSFRHGIGYVKITVPYENVTSIDINFANNCVGDTPTYNLETGAISSLGNSSKNITANVSSGSFVKGQAYYLAAIPRSGYSIGTTEVSYTITGESSPVKVSTEHFSGKNVAVGKIFDLGAPAKLLSPKITYTAPAKLAYDAESGSFPYAVANPVSGQSVTATLESGVDWISNIVVGADAVTFTCSKNNAADAQERSAVITLHYTGAADVPVTVTQGIAGSTSENHIRVYYDKTIELLDGVEVTVNNYFSHSTSYVALATGSDGGNISSFEIPGTSLTATWGLKLDGNGYLRFTTSSTLNSSVSFYYVKRKSGTGKIQITPTDGTGTVYDDVVFGTVKSQTVALEKNTEYTIARNSGELLLVAVVVNETTD